MTIAFVPTNVVVVCQPLLLFQYFGAQTLALKAIAIYLSFLKFLLNQCLYNIFLKSGLV
jgi:hypothetical protein